MNFLQKTFQSQKVYYRYYRRKGLRRFFKENILQTEGSNKNKALSVALGVFIGLSPFWGFHTVVVLFLATAFKLNRLISYMCTHISFPPFIPFIIMASLWLGALFLPGNQDISHLNFTMETVKANLLQYVIGSLALAVTASAVFGLTTYILLRWLRPGK